MMKERYITLMEKALSAYTDEHILRYFNDVKTLMNIGDVVIINASDNTAIKKINITASNVTTAAMA